MMQGFPLRHRLRRGLLCAACVYHMAATLAANVPTNSAFGGELRAPFDTYLNRVGLWQNWVMFHTIPYFRAVRPSLVAHAVDGTDRDYGPMLPGLTPYRHTTRIASLFLRYTWPTDDMEGHVRAYLLRACDEVAQASGVRPKAMGLRLDSLRLRPLAEVRSSQQIGRASSDVSTASVPCP